LSTMSPYHAPLPRVSLSCPVACAHLLSFPTDALPISLSITNVVLIGTNAADFAVTANSCAGSAVPPGSSCGVTITFTPSALGNRTAQLVVFGNATNSPQVVSLTGVGANTAPSIRLVPETVHFGSQPIGC